MSNSGKEKFSISGSDNPLVSIITVVFNGKDFIEDTIRSVASQTYTNVEYIVIDGGSEDGTLDIIMKYKTCISRWVSESDNGIYDAMNKGIELATGDWINFMNAGDFFTDKNVLKNIFEGSNFRTDILYGDAIIDYPTFSTTWKKTPIDSIWKGMCFCHQASFVNTNLMKSWKFDLRYKLSSDFHFLYRAYFHKKKFQSINLLVCNYNYRGGASKTNILRSLEERQKTVLEFQYSFKVWIYYNTLRCRILSTLVIKRILGNNLTNWVTRLVRKQKM